MRREEEAEREFAETFHDPDREADETWEAACSSWLADGRETFLGERFLM